MPRLQNFVLLTLTGRVRYDLFKLFKNNDIKTQAAAQPILYDAGRSNRLFP